MEIYPIIFCLFLGFNTFGSSNAAEITCELKETRFGIVRIEPEGKLNFRVGETVIITCSERYRIFFTKETVKSFKCLDDGQWDKMPVCEEITCEIPRDRHLYQASYYFHGNLRLNERRTYRCLPDYRQMASEATCTKDGWKPDPLCDDFMCEAPNIPNAQFEERTRTRYEVYSRVVYYCRSEPHRRIEINCNYHGRWTNIQPCTVFCSTPLLTVNNASLINEPLDKRTYSHGDTVRYVCADGFQPIGETIAQCDEETWTYPECISIDECLKPTKHLEFMTLLNEKNTYSNFEMLTYSCNSPYNKIPGGSFMCQEGKWLGRFVCTSKICPPPPYLENGDYTIKNQVNNVTTEVYYNCQFYYVLNKQQEYYKCLNGRWETPPKCLKPCKITPDIYKKYNIKPVPDNYTRHSDKDFRLDCNPGRTVEDLFNRRPYLAAWCTDGELRIESKCGGKHPKR